MALTQAQIVQIQHSASLGQAKLYAKAWGVSDQQLADILRTSTIGTLLPNIEQQHIQAGTPVPTQAMEYKQLVQSHPQQTAYTAMGAVALTGKQLDQIKNASSLSEAKKLAESWGVTGAKLKKVLQGSPLLKEGQVPIAIQATSDELRKVQQDQAALAAGRTCPGGASKINLYSITTREGDKLYVYSLSRDTAKDKAIDAGYKVAWVSSIPSGKIPEATVAAPVVGQVVGTTTGRIPTGKVDEIRASTGGNKFLLDALDKAVHANDVDVYNNAVDEYNKVVSDATWFNLYTTYKGYSNQEHFKDNWEWFQKTYAKKLKDSKYMAYLESAEFQRDYDKVIQPANMPDWDFNLIKDYISPAGFDSKGAFKAGKDSPLHAVQIISATNKFILSTASDETQGKLNSGEWTLLPYGQIIETKTLENMPPTYRNIVENSGLCGYEAYQEKVHEWNKSQSWQVNTIDAICAQSVGLGQDIKNFALLQLTATYPEVKEGDPKPMVDPFTPGTVGAGFIGFTTPTVNTYTAEEAAELNARRAEAQKYYKDLYDEAEMAAQEWHASRPSLQPVYPAGFVDSVKKDPSALKDPLLWTETIANTLPYTVATGIIVAGFAGAGPAGVAAAAPLAFGITLSVEGHDIYKDAIAHGASHERALKLANTYGSISAAIETLGDTIFVGVLGVGGGAFASALGKNTGKNIITGAAKKYGWKNLTAGMIKDFVNQGGQEFFQEVVHNAAIKTVDQNQALLENTANAFVSGVIGTAPFVLVPAGGQAIRSITTAKLGDVRAKKGAALTPIDVTPQMQLKILNKVFEPVSGFTVKTTEAEIEHLKQFAPEMLKGGPVEYMTRLWEVKGRNVYKAGKGITVGLVDKKTVITGKTKVDEVALAYNEMCAKVNEYAYTQLKLKQAQKAISDFGLAKSKSQLKMLNEYKKRAAELEAKLKELKAPMVEAVQRFSNVFLENSVGLEAAQKAEVREMPKTIVMDIDSVTTQLFGERSALEIAKDIKELEGQIKVIEDEISKGVTRGQLEGYARLINILKGQVGDLVNELRMRYLAEGEKIKPDTKRLTMEVMSLQARLVKAVENLNNFSGSALNYDVYRKGELAHEAEVVKLERDTLEAIQRTTEAIWGKEHYADKLAELNMALRDLVAIMKEANLSHWRATEISFNIYGALRERRKLQALKKHIQSLKSEASKVKDPSLRQQAEAQVKTVETLTKDLARESGTELRPERAEGRVGITVTKEEIETATRQHRLEYTDADFEAAQNERIRREAERTVSDRFRKLLEHAPGYVRKRTGQELMDYLYEIYDAEYFKVVHEGVFEDLGDYLSVEKEETRIRMQVEHQQWLQKMDEQVASFKAEADLAKDLRDEESGTKRRDTLDKHRDKAKQKAKELRKELKQKQKTRVAVAESEETLSVAEREKLEKIRDRLIQEKLQRLKDKLKSEEKAKKLIGTAKKELVKEETKEEAKAREKESAFPGISTKTKERIMAQVMAAISTKSQVRTKTAIKAAVETAVQTYLKTQTQAATQTQTQTAIQTATETALKLETETATKEEIKTAANIVTKIVTKTVTRHPPLVPPPRGIFKPSKLKQERIRTEPPIASWRQGMYWITIYPPFRTGQKKVDVVYSRHKPPWGKTAKGKHSPRRTLKSIGRVPPLIELPMGVVTARVRNGRRLTFSRRPRRKKRILY